MAALGERSCLSLILLSFLNPHSPSDHRPVFVHWGRRGAGREISLKTLLLGMVECLIRVGKMTIPENSMGGRSSFINKCMCQRACGVWGSYPSTQMGNVGVGFGCCSVY